MRKKNSTTIQASELKSKIRRYASLNIPNLEIAKRLGVDRSYITNILKEKKEKSKGITKILHHAAKLSIGLMKNRREVLEHLLGYPVGDWDDEKVEEEFFRLVEDKNNI